MKNLNQIIKCGQQGLSSIEEICVWILSGSAILLLIAYLFYDNLFMALVLSPYLGFYIKEKRKEKEEEAKRQLTVQFKDAMMAVSFSLNVGYSIENAFKEAMKELVPMYGQDGRIVKEFSGIIRRINNNENVEDVLLEFAERSQIEDITYFAEVFKYAKRSGGDLIAIIKNTATTIRQKIEVEGEIQTIISGKRMEQRVMSIMPFGMILYLRLTSSEMMSSLYGNLVGVVIMTVCLAIYVVSYYMAKKIVDIKV